MEKGKEVIGKNFKCDALCRMLDGGSDETTKYEDFEAFIDCEQYACFLRLVDKLYAEGRISEEEKRLLLEAPYLYFNALLEWFEATPNVRIVIK